MVTTAECPFCGIVKGGDPATREVYRDEAAVAFFPTEPATLGHTLLIPRVHIPDIWKLPEELAAHLSIVTLGLATAIKQAVAPEGLNVIQSNGTAATQSVPHLHIHLVPRWEGDALGRIWPPETHYSDVQKDDVWEKLQAEIRRMETR